MPDPAPAASIGFVGVGNMGAPMARNLAKAGWPLSLYDTNSARSQALAAELACHAAESLRDLAERSDVVITMLPNGDIVHAVVTGVPNGGDALLPALKRGATIVDMSSSAPVGTRRLGEELEAPGIHLIDAPVSGGVKGAVAGKLAIMVGGDKEVAERMDDVLAPMGRRLYVGPLGSGHAAKVLNNFVSAAGMAAAAEAVVVAERFGIEPQVLVDVLNASTGRNNSTENKFSQYILNRKFDSGFALGLMVKDLKLAMDVAEACGVSAKLGEACLQLWADAERVAAAGRGPHGNLAPRGVGREAR